MHKHRRPRTQSRTLRVVVSDEDRAGIEMRAAATGLSVSAYLRNLGLGYKPHSTLDQAVILELVKVNADQGRLGGLLKLWLTRDPVAPVPAIDIRKLLSEIEACQTALKAVIGRLG